MPEIDYPFESLSTTAFQQMSADMLAKQFGLAIRALGPGRDGGRDLYCRGSIPWSGSTFNLGDVWDGYTVFQVKQKDRIESHHKNVNWFSGKIRDELTKWDQKARGRETTPDHLVFITNIPLTADPIGGGRATIEQGIKTWVAARVAESAAEKRASPLAGVNHIEILSREDLVTQVNSSAELRRTYDSFLIRGDVLAELHAALVERKQPDLPRLIREGARRALVEEQWVYFSQAGAAGDDKTAIADVVVDLPVRDRNGHKHSSFLRTIIERSEQRLSHSATLRPPVRHLVLTGPPGNGKTTLSQFVVQLLRSAFVASDTLVNQPRTVSEATLRARERLGLGPIGNRRWPLRIDLADYVRGGGTDTTLLAALARELTRQLGEEVRQAAVRTWLTHWPWALVFDGLDEVSEPKIRRALMAQLTSFVTTIDEADADVLVIVTTRPTGYDEPLDPDHFESLELASLDAKTAEHYGRRLVAQRLPTEHRRRTDVLRGLKTAMEQETTRLLTQTPLQVAILTVLIEGGLVASDRYGLFWGFYETMLKREIAKDTSAGQFLASNRRPVTAVHEGVGFALHGLGEITGNFGATLNPDEFRRVARADLKRRGYEPDSDHQDLLETTCDVATKRLVLLTPRATGGIGFEVRSLQEIMAGRFVSEGRDDARIAALLQVGVNPHWRNAWLFAVGRLYSDDSLDLLDDFYDAMSTFDSNAHWRLGKTFPVAPHLAGALILDGAARKVPAHQTRLEELAVSAVDSFHSLDHVGTADVMITVADASEAGRHRVRAALRGALTRGGQSMETATELQRRISERLEPGSPAAPLMIRALPRIKPTPGVSPQPDQRRSWERSIQELRDIVMSEREIQLMDAAIEVLERLRRERPSDAIVDGIVPALDDPGCAFALDETLHNLGAEETTFKRNLYAKVVSHQRRRAVAPGLDTTGIIRVLEGLRS